MRVKHVADVFLVAACTVLLSGCLASALVGGAVTHSLVGSPGDESYTTAADAGTVFQVIQSELLKTGSVQTADKDAGSSIGFDAKRHYVFVAKIHPTAGKSGSQLDLKVTLIAGSLTVGDVKTIDVMNAFVDRLNADLAGAPLIPVVKRG